MLRDIFEGGLCGGGYATILEKRELLFVLVAIMNFVLSLKLCIERERERERGRALHLYERIILGVLRFGFCESAYHHFLHLFVKFISFATHGCRPELEPHKSFVFYFVYLCRIFFEVLFVSI